MDFQNPRKLPKTIGVKNEITNRIPNTWWGRVGDSGALGPPNIWVFIQ